MENIRDVAPEMIPFEDKVGGGSAEVLALMHPLGVEEDK